MSPTTCRRRLRARRAGRGPRPVRHARRDHRPVPGDRGARRPDRAVRHRGRIAALLQHLHAALPRRGRPHRDRSRRRARARAPRAGRDRDARGGAPGRRRAAADRVVPRAARADTGARPGDPRRRGRPRACAQGPLAGRRHRLPRRGRAPPLRQAGADQAEARQRRPHPAVRARHWPGARVPRPGGRHLRSLARRRRARAGEADPQRVRHRRRLGEPGHRRARRVQPRPPEGGVGRGRDDPAQVRRSAPARRLHRARSSASRSSPSTGWCSTAARGRSARAAERAAAR